MYFMNHNRDGGWGDLKEGGEFLSILVVSDSSTYLPMGGWWDYYCRRHLLFAAGHFGFVFCFL